MDNQRLRVIDEDEGINEKRESRYTKMSTTLKENRPKRPIVKPLRYQTTSSDEAPPRIATKTGEQETNVLATMEADMREFRGILQENLSHVNDNNSQIQHNSQLQHNSQIYKAQVQTSTHSQHQLEQVANQYPSQIPTNIESYPTLPYSITPYTQHRHATCSSTFIPNERNTFDNIINAYSKFQDPHSNAGESVQITGSYRAQPEQMENETENRKTQERLDRIETELRKLNSTMERIYKCVQIKEKRRRALQKPKCLPISTELEMQIFETIDEETYEEVVEYLQYVGGFTVKEAINLSFKEVIKDSLTVAYTWFGCKQGPRPLYKTRIIMVIYDAVCNNRNFNKPTRAEFQAYAKEALRSAKQRHRMATHVQRNKEQHDRTARDYWKDCNEENEEQNDVESNMDSHDEDD